MVFLWMVFFGLAVFLTVASVFGAVYLASEWWHSRPLPEDDEPYSFEPKSEPSDLFICPVCGTGPWHKAWGRICPNCSGAD
jgi:hypothetical protein